MIPFPSIAIPVGEATTQVEAPEPPAFVIMGETVPAVPVHKFEGE